MSKIAVVEDDNNIQKLICYALSAAGYEAKGYDGGSAFLADIMTFNPELVILDIMMPGIDGVEVLKRVRRHDNYKDVPVMMLTAKSGEIDKVNTLDLGADDYMTKPFGVMEMMSRVRALLRRSAGRHTGIDGITIGSDVTLKPDLKFKSVTIDVNRHIVKVEEPESGEVLKPELTLKEFELLSYMMHNQGLVLTREQIMQSVWGYDYEGESRTIDMHIKSLRQKLGSAGSYIKTVRGVGYRMADD